jgi:SAM-dependent methyltransferase
LKNEPDNREQLSRVYSEETWRVYEALDQSLEPRGPSSLYDVAGSYLKADAKILDAGCRDATHLIELVRRYGATGVGIDPVDVHIERAHAAVEAAELDDRIRVFVGVMQELPFPDGHFDFVWCRDVVTQVDGLEAALRETARVLSPDGHMLVYATLRTDQMSPQEAELFSRHLGNVPASLMERNVEDAFTRAGLAIERKDIVGTEWREYAEERTQPVSLALLRLSRLRRQRDALVAKFGEDICDSVEANLHWETFQFLGKLLPTVYVLRRRPEGGST